MKQMTFADAEYAGKRKQTRRELFLIEMDQVVPWKRLVALIEPHYPKGEGGRPAYPLMAMLRVHLMQNWFGYSDPAMEEALYETTILRQFAGLNLERIPDETTILNFRRLLEKNDLAAGILGVINGYLGDRGLSLRQGTIVDATLIYAPSSTKKKEGKRDPEMHQTKKGNQYCFGAKAHIGVDVESGLVHHVHVTAANVAYVTQVDKLLHGEENMVAADAGYTGVEKREEHEGAQGHLADCCSAQHVRKVRQEKRAVQGTPQHRESQSADTFEGRAPVSRDQTSVWLHQGAISRFGEERRTDDDVVRTVEPVDGTPIFIGEHSRGAPVMWEMACAVQK